LRNTDDPKPWKWESFNRITPLQVGEAHVWLVELTGGSLDRDTCWPVLSDGEQAKSERYKHDGAREEFVISRAVLRSFLARYVGADSEAITYRTAPGGKPFLQEMTGKPVPWFNMTHSRGVALYAFSIDQEVGVDVEMVNRRTDAEGLARRFFTARESERICSRSELLREAFIRTWTCKEASLKWTGKGLKGGLKTHEILFSPAWDEPRAVGDGDQPELTLLTLGGGYVGALATTHRPLDVVCKVLDGSQIVQ
jgi:4'-phosphopantetheinyl transferase